MSLSHSQSLYVESSLSHPTISLLHNSFSISLSHNLHHQHTPLWFSFYLASHSFLLSHIITTSLFSYLTHYLTGSLPHYLMTSLPHYIDLFILLPHYIATSLYCYLIILVPCYIATSLHCCLTILLPHNITTTLYCYLTIRGWPKVGQPGT